MPLSTGGPDTLSNVQNEGLSGQRSSLGDSLVASYASGMKETPIFRIGDFLNHIKQNQQGDTLTPQDANEKYGIKGILNFDNPVSSSLAATLNKEKQDDLIRQNTIRNGPSGIVNGALSLTAGAIPSFLDPINAVAMFVPGLGEERITAGLTGVASRAEGVGLDGLSRGLTRTAEANGKLGTALSSSIPGRIAQGASQGVAGMAALEPLNMFLDRDEHNDWTMGQALKNIAFGGLMGGGLHGAGALLERHLNRGTQDIQPSSSKDVPLSLPDTPLDASTSTDTLNAQEAQTPSSSTSSYASPNEHLNTTTPHMRGQSLGESIAALTEDRPSNADSLLQINKAQQDQHDLEQLIERHTQANDAPLPIQRDTVKNELARLHQTYHQTTQQKHLLNDQERPATPSQRSLKTASPIHEGPSLFTFLTKHGGVLDEGGELKASDIHKQRIGLVRRQGGLSLDQARLLAEEHGYIKNDADINDLLDAMIEESHGKKHYANGYIASHSEFLNDDTAYEEHNRDLAQYDIENTAHQHNLSLDPTTQNLATDGALQGANPEDALEDALKTSSYNDWQHYVSSFDKSRLAHYARLDTKREALHSLAEHTLGRYAQRLDAGILADALPDMASNFLSHDTPTEAIESLLQNIEGKKGQGFDPTWAHDIQNVYQKSLQILAGIKHGAAEDIIRNLHGHDNSEITDSRAGLAAQREHAPTPERSQQASPLSTREIDHLDLSDVGNNPELIGHMPHGIENVPSWPVVLGDGEHTIKLDTKGRDIGGGHGRAHIIARHGHEIEKRGFKNTDAFVKRTLMDMNQIRLDEKNGSFFAIKMGEKQGSRHKHPSAILHLIKKDGYYRVGTSDEFKTGYLKNRKLLWEKDLSTNSNPTGQGSVSFNPRGQKMSDTPRSGRDNDRQSSNQNSDDVFSQSQDKSLTEAQDYGARLDQQLALHGENAISPKEIDNIRHEQSLSEGNANALSSATECLIRNGQ